MGPQPDFQVGSGQFHFVVADLHENVGQDRHRVALFDDALQHLKLFEDDFFFDGKFHDFTFLTGPRLLFFFLKR